MVSALRLLDRVNDNHALDLVLRLGLLGGLPLHVAGDIGTATCKRLGVDEKQTPSHPRSIRVTDPDDFTCDAVSEFFDVGDDKYHGGCARAVGRRFG
jgi:hypothetical protein